MVAACELAPKDKKAFVDAVGIELVRKHGKQRYYRPADVAEAAAASGYSVAVHCWPIASSLVHAILRRCRRQYASPNQRCGYLPNDLRHYFVAGTRSGPSVRAISSVGMVETRVASKLTAAL